MKLSKTLAAALLMSVFTITLTACDQGPAEDAGESIDDTFDDAGDAIDDTFD